MGWFFSILRRCYEVLVRRFLPSKKSTVTVETLEEEESSVKCLSPSPALNGESIDRTSPELLNSSEPVTNLDRSTAALNEIVDSASTSATRTLSFVGYFLPSVALQAHDFLSRDVELCGMATSVDFRDVFIEDMGTINRGSLRLTDQHIKFHNDHTGNIVTMHVNELKKVTWQRLANKPGAKFVFDDGKRYRIGGFKETDFDQFKAFAQENWQKDVEKTELALKGWNYGECTVAGQSVEFSVDGKLCFEVPLSNVSNTIANKNEAVLEFHQNEDCAIALTEMRFHMPSNEEDMYDAVDEFRQAVLKYAGIETDSGQAIVTLSQILATTPRGRYDIKVYPNHLSLHGKTYDYKIPIKTIQRLFLVPHKDGRHMYFVCALSPPIRQGQTRYHYLVFEFVRDDETEIELGLTEEQVKEQFGEKLQRNLEGPVYEIVCKLFRVLVGMKVTTPGKFVGHSGTPAIVCAHKQASGFLYPLEKGFLYIHKPPMYIRFEECASVHFARSDISTRSFDFEVEMKGGSTNVFNSVEKEEYSKLYDYVQSKGLRIRNAKKAEARNTDMFDDSDEDHDPYKEHVKKEGKDRQAERAGATGGDEESDPEDDDYDLDIDLARRRKEREENSSEGDESEPTEEFDSSGSDVVKESDMDEDEDAKKERKEKKKLKAEKRKEKREKDGDESKGRKKRAKKDPNAPKRYQSAYMIWLNENRSTIKKDGDTVADTAKRGGELWKAMTEDDKKQWEEKSAKDKTRYEAEMAEWKKSGGSTVRSSTPTKSSKPSSKLPTKSPNKQAKSREFLETSSDSDAPEDGEKKKKKKKQEKAKVIDELYRRCIL
ncbi:unnamed protein product, partial [Mesorhabditis spiculigera]